MSKFLSISSIRSSIRTKILLGNIFLILLISVFIYTYFPNKQEEKTLREIEQQVNDINNLMSTGVGIGLGEFDIVAISEVLNWAKRDSALAYIVVLDKSGHEIINFNDTGKELDIEKLSARDQIFEEDRILHAKEVLNYSGKVYGTLLTGYSLENMDKAIAEQRETIFYICLSIFTIGVILSFVISDRITENIRKLNYAVNAITHGNTNIEVAVSGNDESGKLAIAFNQMIKSLKQSQSELIASNQYTENIISSMLDSLFVLNEEYKIITTNRAASTLLGYEEAELMGKSMAVIFKDQADVQRMQTVLEQESRLPNEENTFITKSGKPVPVLFSAANIFDNFNQFQGVVCVAQNITEIKRVQQNLEDYSKKLEKTNKELDQFAYVVSHDLKAPLRAIYNLSQWIQEDTEDILSEENKKQMALLRGRVTRLEALINGILDYGKIGKSSIETELVDVKNLLYDIIDLLAPPPKFSITIDGNMPVFRTERARLHQVFSNLIDNAIKFNDSPKGEIKIAVEEETERYRFSVEDNGPGIEEAYFEKIFVIFQTLEARDKVESTGIGLTTAKKIVEEKGCKIWIESEIGKGSKFIFTWPKE